MAAKIRRAPGAESVTEASYTIDLSEFFTRFAKRFGEDAIVDLDDLGNWGWKRQRLGEPSTRTLMRNRIAQLSPNDWERQIKRWKFSRGQFSNTVLFGLQMRGEKKEWAYFAAGDGAENFPGVITMTDDIKYDYNAYWGAVVAANLIRSLPNGHRNIVMAMAHPLKSVGQRETMMMATLGHHNVKLLTGETLRYTVREVFPWDEPLGGAVAWATGSTGHDLVYNRYGLKPGDMILNHDIGGGMTTMNRLQVDYDSSGRLIFVPIYDQKLSPTIEIGLRDVQVSLRDILLQENEAFQGMGNNLTYAMIDEGIATGKIKLSGNNEVDVTTERQYAEAPLWNAMKTVYTGTMAGGRPFALITTTGGGMHSYHERLKAEMYNHAVVEPCISLDMIEWANMQGGGIIAESWINKELGYV